MDGFEEGAARSHVSRYREWVLNVLDENRPFDVFTPSGPRRMRFQEQPSGSGLQRDLTAIGSSGGRGQGPAVPIGSDDGPNQHRKAISSGASFNTVYWRMKLPSVTGSRAADLGFRRSEECLMQFNGLDAVEITTGRGHACHPAENGYILAFNECASLKATIMAQLTVRNVSPQLIRSLKSRAAANGRSAEAEHREILRKVLLEAEQDFASRAKVLRKRLRSSIDSTEIIRADRDRDSVA